MAQPLRRIDPRNAFDSGYVVERQVEAAADAEFEDASARQRNDLRPLPLDRARPARTADDVRQDVPFVKFPDRGSYALTLRANELFIA